MSIECQIEDLSLYNRLKSDAFYYSDRTHVLVLPDKYKNLIAQGDSDFSINEQAVLKYDKGRFVIDHGSDSLLYYLGVSRKGVHTFSSKALPELTEVIEQGIINCDESFLEAFTPLSRRATISDLNASQKKIKSGRKYIDLAPYNDLELSFIFSEMKESIKNTKTVEGTLLYAEQNTDFKGRVHFDIEAQFIDNDGQTGNVTHNFYAGPNYLETFVKAGQKINLLLSNDNKVLNILPEGLKVDTIIAVSPNSQVKKELPIPVEVFRILYAEYSIRKLRNF